MKNILKLFCMLVLMMAFASCDKEENKIYVEKFTAPVFTHTGDAVLVLTKPTEAVFAARFDWTNPNFEFTTGVNPQDITYTLQVDTTGQHFANDAFDLTAVDNDFTLTATQGQLNKWLQPLKLQVDVPHRIEFRLKASVKGSAGSVYSNIITLTVTPYLDVEVDLPLDGTLWLIGNAFASDWTNPMLDPYKDSQKFTRLSETIFEITANFIGGGNFKIIQRQGDWDMQYRPKYDSNVPFGEGDFEKRNADPGWNGPAAAGQYKITLDFITGKYKIVQI